MIEQSTIDKYKAYIFEFDDVLYPEKDYLLQVYYLFAQFMEYTVQNDAAEMLGYMKEQYEKYGAAGIFDNTKTKFTLEEEYRLNFDLLNRNAKLPLKLLMFPKVLEFLKKLVQSGKQVFLLSSGNPEKQLNKLRQLEWEGLAQHIKVYFADEIAQKPDPVCIEFVLQEHSLHPDNVMFIGRDIADENMAAAAGVFFLNVEEL
ncbi:HAD family hydrolase [Pedobacter duraquae]|uniref:phosphoglycolate phosphatase n=1 Tax=Pedobacter duraquae TaxID=425511 RepID=A0A4R6IKN2_9SPHI|nr:HAD family hydrolase [Pedobacter duraquae]TDO22632.1 FMN phosphatase YigB (HAD superfamily) [Pedobacter duraquae]